jgi:hypothetical protein
VRAPRIAQKKWSQNGYIIELLNTNVIYCYLADAVACNVINHCNSLNVMDSLSDTRWPMNALHNVVLSGHILTQRAAKM